MPPRPSHLARLTVLAALIAAAVLAGCRDKAAMSTAALITLEVGSDGEFLAFAPAELTCRAGARVRLIFHHRGLRIPQEHNWVLLKPGTEAAVATAATVAGAAAGWVPSGDVRVLAATALCGPGKNAEVVFTAPSAAGDYPYVCTFPGHAAEMHGVLHITPS